MDNLNSYNTSWNKWLLNTNNKSVTFKVNNGKGFSISSQLILLPSLAESENHNFSGWFEDEKCTKEFTGSSVEADTVLYGGWVYTLSFNFGNGTTTKKIFKHNDIIIFPDATREGYDFDGWFSDSDYSTPFTEETFTGDITIYAKYTKMSGGSDSSESFAFKVNPFFVLVSLIF